MRYFAQNAGGVPFCQRGFSLLEVIAAILLLAISFATLMQVAGGASGLTSRAIAYDKAAMWARSKLDSALVLEAPHPGITQGRFDQHYRWQLQVMPWEGLGVTDSNSVSYLRVYKLKLKVTWGSKVYPSHAYFSTLRVARAANEDGSG